MRVLPENLRYKLKEQIGSLVDEKGLLKLIKNEKLIVSVGDMVTFTLLKNGINPNISVVDYFLERKKSSTSMKETISRFGKEKIKIKNPSGTITDELWNAIKTSYERIKEGPFLIEVDGEEDLASLVAIYLAPPYATVIYGLPNKGVIVVKVTEEYKSKAKEILDRM